MADVKEISLSVIDLSPARMADPAGRKKETRKLIDCFSTVGFCQIEGLEGYDPDELFRWERGGAFFVRVRQFFLFRQCFFKSFASH